MQRIYKPINKIRIFLLYASSVTSVSHVHNIFPNVLTWNHSGRGSGRGVKIIATMCMWGGSNTQTVPSHPRGPTLSTISKITINKYPAVDHTPHTHSSCFTGKNTAHAIAWENNTILWDAPFLQCRERTWDFWFYLNL